MTTAPAPAPTPAQPAKLNLFQEFRAFLDKYGVIGLAIAFVIGAALTAFVKAVVQDLLMPIVGLITPGGYDKAVFYWPPLPADAKPDDPTYVLPPHTWKFPWGDLLNSAVNFVIIALFVFVVAKFVLRQKEVGKI